MSNITRAEILKLAESQTDDFIKLVSDLIRIPVVDVSPDAELLSPPHPASVPAAIHNVKNAAANFFFIRFSFPALPSIPYFFGSYFTCTNVPSFSLLSKTV